MSLLHKISMLYRLDREYKRFISSRASVAFNSRWHFAFVAILLIVAAIDYSRLHATQFKHFPTIALIVFGHFLSRYAVGPRWVKAAPFYMDLTILTGILAAVNLTVVCYAQGFPLNSAPIQISLFMGCLIGYHSSITIILRNLTFATITALSLWFFGSYQILLHDSLQILIGFGGGTVVYVSLFEAKLRAQFESFKKADAATERLHQVAAATKYNHQVQMIKEGFNEEETLPISLNNAVLLKLDMIGSSRVRDPLFERSFTDFCEKIEQKLLESMQLTSKSPPILVGPAFFIKQVGDAAIFSIGNPTHLPRGLDLASAIDDLLLHIRTLFDESMANVVSDAPIRFCIGIAYDELRGGFSGKRKTYDLTGRAQILAERYESLRKNLPSSIKLPSGQHYVIMQDKVISLFRNSPNFEFQRIEFPPNTVRDDSTATHAWLLTYKSVHDEISKVS